MRTTRARALVRAGTLLAIALSLLATTSGPAAALQVPPTLPPPSGVYRPALTTPLPRVKADAAGLYTTNAQGQRVPFRWRGANFVRLAPGPNGTSWHSTFEPGLYDTKAVSAMLAQMKHDGYNGVRVYIDPGVTNAAQAHGIGRGNGTTGAVYGPYVDNVADFVKRAALAGVYVVPSMDAFPQNDTYWNIVKANPGTGGVTNMDGDNRWYMAAGYAAAKREYLKQFAAALAARVGGAERLSTILAYQTNNEVAFDSGQAPYNKMSGTVTPLNGRTYDMADPAQRQQAADASLVEYARRARQGLRASVDPNALMTMGFYTNNAVGKPGFNGIVPTPGGKPRFPGRPAALSRAQADTVDFIDMHTYPSSRTAYSVQQDLQSSELSLFAKPFIIGEMGARKDIYGYDVRAAAYGMRDLQIATCKLGAQGWATWTWDTVSSLANQDKFFNQIESNGSINGQLAPIVRPDPCR